MDIYLRRKKAAELSLGKSSDTIYRLIESVIVDHNMSGSALDYGAGTGELAKRLLRLNRFSKVSGADILRPAQELDGRLEWLEQDLNGPLLCQDDMFDLVVAAEVIEHLENPRFMLREIYRVLRPEGKVILTTPNNESWRSLTSLLVRGQHVAFTDTNYPAHITPILRSDLSRGFTEAGFTLPAFLYTGVGSIPGLSWSWQDLTFGILRGLRFSDNVLALASKEA